MQLKQLRIYLVWRVATLFAVLIRPNKNIAAYFIRRTLRGAVQLSGRLSSKLLDRYASRS